MAHFMTFDEWIELGKRAGLQLVPFCAAHDMPYTREEAELFDQGDDPCLPAVRLIDDRPDR